MPGFAFAAMLAVGLVFAGCGSSDNDKSSSTPAPTKAEFVSKGNAICKKGNQEIAQGANKTFSADRPPTQAQLKAFATGTLIPSVQSQISALRALGTPEGDEAKVKAMLTSAQAALARVKQDPSLVANEKNDPFAGTNKLLAAYGLTECASGGPNG
jgi:hypothetical protein